MGVAVDMSLVKSADGIFNTWIDFFFSLYGAWAVFGVIWSSCSKMVTDSQLPNVAFIPPCSILQLKLSVSSSSEGLLTTSPALSFP